MYIFIYTLHPVILYVICMPVCIWNHFTNFVFKYFEIYMHSTSAYFIWIQIGHSSIEDRCRNAGKPHFSLTCVAEYFYHYICNDNDPYLCFCCLWNNQAAVLSSRTALPERSKLELLLGILQRYVLKNFFSRNNKCLGSCFNFSDRESNFDSFGKETASVWYFW